MHKHSEYQKELGLNKGKEMNKTSAKMDKTRELLDSANKHYKDGNYKLALKDYNSVLEISEGKELPTWVYANVITILTLLNQLKDATNFATKTLARGIKCDKIYRSLAILYEKKMDWEKCLSYLNMTVEASNKQPDWVEDKIKNITKIINKKKSAIEITRRQQKAATESDKKESVNPKRFPIPYFGLDAQKYTTKEVVYSCIVGKRHMLESSSDSGFEHVIYSDHNLSVEGWNRRPIMFWDTGPKTITLFHKYSLVNFLEPNTKMIWVDSRISISDETLRSIFDALDHHDLCLFDHYERNCVYDEIYGVIKGGRATREQCHHYSNYIRSINLPRELGLYETGVLGFKVTENVKKIFRDTFALSYKYIHRDQLTLPIALHNQNYKPYVFGKGQFNLRNTPGIIVKPWKKHA